MSVCFVCPVTLEDLLTVVKTNEDDVAWNIAMSHGLTKRIAICYQCHRLLYLETGYKFKCYGSHSVEKGNVFVEEQCITFINGKSGTLFEQSDQSVGEILAMIWYFLDFDLSGKQASMALSLNNKTVADWNNLFSDVLLHYCVHNSSQLGGPGKVVEIRWTKLGKRRHHNYHWAVTGKWILAGVESESNYSFVHLLANSSEDDLIHLIQQWIRPGSTIIFDGWEGFTKLLELDYMYYTSSCFREKKRSYMSTWMDFWCLFFQCRQGNSFDSYISKSIFSYRWPNKSERFHHFLLAAARLFPPNY